jgi:predicted metal-dependent hydrolase
MRNVSVQHIRLDGQHVRYRLVASPSARKLRVRVGPNGVEVVQPKGRSTEEVATFLQSNETWILGQLGRADELRRIRRPDRRKAGEILYRGEPTRVRIEKVTVRGRHNRIVLSPDGIVIRCPRESQTAPTRSLELWLRKRARQEIDRQLAIVTKRLNRHPRHIYVMDQRTKWGNCSTKQNLSFSWRLVCAPEFVLRYLVTHEAVHLAIPDHSQRFWLTVRSLFPQTERARQWLCANEHKLRFGLEKVTSAKEDRRNVR